MFNKRLFFCFIFLIIIMIAGCSIIPPTPVTHTITIISGDNGSVTPEGKTSVIAGDDLSLNITAENGYVISDILIDGKSILRDDEIPGKNYLYTFTDVQKSHTIEVIFKKETLPPEPGPYPGQKKYTVQFLDWDSKVLKTQLVVEGNSATAPANPTRVGHTFTGWDKPFNNVTSDLTVTAQYSINQYTITFDSDGGTDVDSITQDYGTPITAPANPTKNGYTFNGWNPPVPATMPAENITLKAQWTIKSYTVVFQDYDGTELSTQTVEHGNSATAPANPTRVGHTFTGWDKPFNNVTSDLTVTAQYSINQYTITFDSDGGTDVDSITQDYGTPITAPANPTKNGYTFNGWNPPVPATMPAENITLKAQWTIKSYTLTYNAGTGGSITGISPQTVEHGGDGTEVEAVPEFGYHFVRWNDDSTDNPRTDTNVTGDITVIAEFKAIIAHNINQDKYYYTTIQAAINEALSGQVVEVYPGIHNENIVLNNKNIKLQSYSGNPDDTIIDGGGNGSVVTFVNGDTSTLSGFTITNGRGMVAAEGGGIHVGKKEYVNDLANPTITNNIITGNVSARGGGGILVNLCDANITNNIISNNTAVKYGGGIAIYYSSNTIVSGNIIENNEVDGSIEGTGSYGGGIVIWRSAVTLTNNTVTENTVTGNVLENLGGGLFVSYIYALYPESDWGIMGSGVDNPVLTGDPPMLVPAVNGEYIIAGNKFSGNLHGASLGYSEGANVYFSKDSSKSLFGRW